jgi:hypothetical protein
MRWWSHRTGHFVSVGIIIIQPGPRLFPRGESLDPQHPRAVVRASRIQVEELGFHIFFSTRPSTRSVLCQSIRRVFRRPCYASQWTSRTTLLRPRESCCCDDCLSCRMPCAASSRTFDTAGSSSEPFRSLRSD